MMSKPDITVVIATFDNARELQRTLEGFSNADRQGLRVEFAIVDNDSKDATRSVIESFNGRLPIRYLHESRKGKCAALNLALRTMEFGSLIFFTDDDVDIPRDLFTEMVACASRNGGSSVFGGQVHLVWPPGEVPAWAKALARSFKAYSHIDLGPEECAFPSRRAPMGTNWWIRRELLQRGYRFDERIGPGSGRSSMGDETAFLLRLVRDGHPILYSPAVRVGHRVPARLLTEKEIIRQALSAGRAGALLAYEYGFGPARSVRSDLGWSILRTGCLARWALCYACAFMSLGKTRQMIRRWDAMQGVGWNLEALRILTDEKDIQIRGTRTPASV